MALLPAIIGGAAAIGSAIFGAKSSKKQNESSREWSEKMYERQRADEIEFWNMQNSYNSPEAQMQRLRDANLNPHMAYGSGNVSGNSASKADVPNAHKPEFNTTRVDLPAIVNSYFDVKQKAAQANNTKLQGDLLKLEAINKGLQNTYDSLSLEDRLKLMKYTKQYKHLDAYQLSNLISFNTGLGTPYFASVGDGKQYQEGSFYDLQAKGMELTNKLRGAELKSKSQDYDINSLRKEYYNRIFSPDASALSFKDWLQLILSGVSVFKK